PGIGSRIEIAGAIRARSVQVTGSDDEDEIIVSAVAPGVPLAVDGQGGSDTYIVTLGTLSGPVTVQDTGAAGSDRLLVNGTSVPDILGLTATTVTLASEIVTYSGCEQVTVDAGEGTDTVMIDGAWGTVLGG